MDDAKIRHPTCPRCGRASPRAGEACACGAAAGAEKDKQAQDVYDLAPQAVSAGTVANSSAGAKPSTVAEGPEATGGRGPRTLAYLSPKDQARAGNDPQTIRDLYLPLWLLGGGVLVEVIGAAIRERNVTAALMYVGVELVFGTIVMLAGLLLVSRIRQIDLGRFWVAVFKLSAVSVAPAALVTLLTPALNVIPLGMLLGWAGGFVLYFALLGALFDLDQSDTWYCVCVIFLVRLAVYFLLLWIEKR